MELNVDQIRIVNSKPNGHVLVKGVAGSGKTTVAVSKIPVLVNHYMNQKDEILFVTYNKTLIEYTQHLMKDMDIQQNLFFEFDVSKQLKVKTIDSIIMQYARSLKPVCELATNVEMKDVMLKAIAKVKRNYAKYELISEKYYTFLSEEIDWLKSCGYIERETYLNIDRIGRMSKGENRYRLQKNSPERSAIFDIYLLYEEIMKNEKLVDFKTNALRVLEAFRTGQLKPKTYRHIIVDESQDLTRIQLEIIKHLYRETEENASIMFIADVSQSIYTHSWLSGQSFKSIGFDMSGKSNILSKNYRTTYEIAQAAYSLIEKDDTIKQNDIFVKPVAIERHGDAPYYKHYDNVVQEVEGIAKRIKQLVTRYQLKDIVVVAANNGCLSNIKDVLVRKGIPAEIFNKAKPDFEEDTVRLFTLYSVKGLEFPVLFIACINEGVLPYSQEEISIGRRLLYVGMTRAKQELYLSSSQKESVFIAELDKSLLCSDETEFSPLYKVDISEYLFKDKIQNIHSREEMVRQWFLRELMIKKQYPKSELDIEFSVQFFSKRGAVDVVAYQYQNGQRAPYIMAEIKKPGEDMDYAMKQLRSYVNCCPSVEYIVVTNGKDMVMGRVNQNQYETIQSLPPYQEKQYNMYEEYEYVDKQNNRNYGYEINCEDREEIVIKNGDTKEVIDCGRYHDINVIGQVAAGVLKQANEEKLGKYKIPDFLLAGKSDVFLLEVHGDSMVKFYIDDGDLVLVQKQSYAKNWDIVVAGKRGMNEVTLKQYHIYQEGMVGLVPGNDNYEAIIIQEKEVFVNGVVVGVLKRKKYK